MSEEFSTTPGKIIVQENIIGTELSDLTDLSAFQNDHATLTNDGTITVNGVTFNVVKMVYQAQTEL